MKKLLILGASINQLPAVRMAQSMGYHVHTLSNISDDVAHEYANEHAIISTIDKEQVLEYAVSKQIDAIYTIASDIALPTLAYVAYKMGLKACSMDVIDVLTDKILFRNWMHIKGYSAIKYYHASTFEEAKDVASRFDGSFVLKPARSSGSKGVAKLSNISELNPDIFKNTKYSNVVGDRILLEEFKEGQEYGGNLILVGFKVVQHCITRKWINTHLSTVAHAYPCGLSDDIIQQLLDKVESIAFELQMNDSPIDIDAIFHSAHGWEIIEMSSRLGGNGVSELAGLSGQHDMLKTSIDLAFNNNISYCTSGNYSKVSSIVLSSEVGGVLIAWKDIPDILSKCGLEYISWKPFKHVGDTIYPLTSGGYQLGIAFVRFTSLEQIDTLLTHSFVEISTM